MFTTSGELSLLMIICDYQVIVTNSNPKHEFSRPGQARCFVSWPAKKRACLPCEAPSQVMFMGADGPQK